MRAYRAQVFCQLDETDTVFNDGGNTSHVHLQVELVDDCKQHIVAMPQLRRYVVLFLLINHTERAKWVTFGVELDASPLRVDLIAVLIIVGQSQAEANAAPLTFL